MNIASDCIIASKGVNKKTKRKRKVIISKREREREQEREREREREWEQERERENMNHPVNQHQQRISFPPIFFDSPFPWNAWPRIHAANLVKDPVYQPIIYMLSPLPARSHNWNLIGSKDLDKSFEVQLTTKRKN